MFDVDVTFRRTKTGLRVRHPEGVLNLPLPNLLGPHQRRNAAIAAAAATRLGFTEDQIADGITHVRWPGRMQRLGGAPETWLDGAHNPAAVARLIKTLAELNIQDGFTLVFGAHPFKNTRRLLTRLAARAGTVICTQAERLSPAKDLAALLPGRPDVHAQPDCREAVRQARALGRTTLVAGSLYLAGELLGRLETDSLQSQCD